MLVFVLFYSVHCLLIGLVLREFLPNLKFIPRVCPKIKDKIKRLNSVIDKKNEVKNKYMAKIKK